MRTSLKYVWTGTALLLVFCAARFAFVVSVPRAAALSTAGGAAVAQLVAQLNSAGAGAMVAGSAQRAEFSVPGTTIIAGNDSVQVFEYSDAAAASAAIAGFVQVHGQSWPEKTIYLYKADGAVIFYMGTNEKMMQTLTALAGPPVAR